MNSAAGPRTGIVLRAGAMATTLLLAAACGRNEADGSGSSADAADPAFVGREVCAGCHEEEAERWLGSHHDLAMQPATEATVLGRFDETPFVHDGVTSVFFRRDGGYWVRTDGPDGALEEFRITHTFGVEPLQQYLVAAPGGRLQALGIAWDARPRERGGQRWFHLYPGETIDSSDPLHFTRAAQNWNAGCAACHATALTQGYDPEQGTFATEWAEIDVGCEACHGPGSLHAAAPDRVAPRLGARARTWAFAPGAPIAARVPAAPDETEIEVCAQCHARRAQIHEPFAAGDPLLDDFVPARLDEGLYHADGQIQDEVFVYGSFVQSRMYRAGVTCSDCHDPHAATLRADGNALCARCHDSSVFAAPEHHRHEPGAAGSACVDCHMRSETYMVVDPRRDHSFRVPRPDLSVSLGTPNACNDCHRERTAEWAAREVETWFPAGRSTERHYGEALHAGRAWAADRVPLLERLIADRDAPAIARATAVTLLARHIDSATLGVLEEALAEGEDEVVQLAALHVLDRIPAEARARFAQRFLTHPRRALRIAAARALVPARTALSERRRADLDAALNEWIAAQALTGDRVDGLLNRALLAAERGNVDDAETLLTAAIEREPSLPPAYANLADLYRRTGREADAERTLREGLALRPDDADLHYALGLSLVRSGRLDGALPVLERASRLAPAAPQYAYASGIAQSSAGERERAIATLTAAAERFPGHPPTLLALATLHRDAGNLDGALAYARQVLAISPADPTARALEAELRAARARD